MAGIDGSTTKDLAIEATSIHDVHTEAQINAAKEHEMTFMQAIKTYPTAVAWALFFSLGVIMAVRRPYLWKIADNDRHSTHNLLAIFMRLRHSNVTSDTFLKATISFRRHGKQV